MGLRRWWARFVAFVRSPHGDVKSFEHEVEGAGVTGRVDAGLHTVPASKIVGSVGRSQNLRSDFFYKTGKVTGRFVRIGQAMQSGHMLPPIEVYKARLRRRRGDHESTVTEYYVVDGHHRVAMAKKLGQDFLDAHVVEYRVSPPPAETPGVPPAADQSPPAPGPSSPPPGPSSSPPPGPSSSPSVLHREEEERGRGDQVQGQ